MLTISTSIVNAQSDSGIRKKWYRSDAGDLCLFSFSNVSRNGDQLKNIPRFIYLNSITHVNKDLSDKVSFFTGFSVSNLGVIYDENDSVRYKRRVITTGLSAGLKLGNIQKSTYFFLEGQLNLAVNYKEKRFVNDKKVDKSNTWFGDQTPLLMPAISAGFLYEEIGLKAQYFPSNFFNTDYQAGGVRPFAGMQAQVFVFTITYDFKTRMRNRSQRTGSNLQASVSDAD